MAAIRKNNVINDYVPEDRILKFDIKKLSTIRLQEYNNLYCRLKTQLNGIYRTRRHTDTFRQINIFLIREGAIIE